MTEIETYSDVNDELSVNFLSYAAAVNTDRAIPDSKSGLKPVARRILYAMHMMGLNSNKPHIKCQEILGVTMGKYHPHGDSSIYGALVRLSQDWSLRYPLIHFHGNKGSIAGDGPAAPRYTEARLSKISEFGMLDGIKKKVVDFVDNYSETTTEPVTLVSLFPNLLCNPNTGIGVSLACNWLPHNLNEVASAIQAYIENPDITIDELVKDHLPGPDYPLGGRIINKNNMLSCYKTGRGRVITQARYELETRGKDQLVVFRELPFGVNSEALLLEINKLHAEGKLPGVETIQDESDKHGVRIVIIMAKGGNIAATVTKLYHSSKLQSNESFNQVALVNKVPTLLNLKQSIEIYVEHQLDVITREINFDLVKATTRMNIVEGILIALEDIDNVIKLIKGSKSSADARVQLAEKYKMNDEQTKAIVDMKLGRIAGLEKIEVQNEHKELLEKIAECNNILANRNMQEEILVSRLSDLVKKYGDARRTELAQIEITKEEKSIDAIEPEDVVVVLTKGGHIKRIPVKSFKIQKRNGKGTKSKDDSILDIIKTNTVDTLILFSSTGRIFRIVTDDIPEAGNAGVGTAVSSLVKTVPGEEILAVTSLYRKTTANMAVFITANGMIKKTAVEEYTVGKRSLTGLAAIKLKDDDKVVDITFLNDEELILISRDGMAIRVATSDINPVGRVTLGVKGMKLAEGDEVVAAVPVHKVTDKLAVFTKTGFGKKVALSEFIKQGRNGKGVLVYKGEQVVGAEMVCDEDNILIMGSMSNIGISAKDMPEGSRLAQGSSMIKNSSIVSVVKI